MRQRKVQTLSSTDFFVRSELRWWVGGLVLSLCLAVFEYAGLLGWVRSAGEVVSRPVRQATVMVWQQVSLPAQLLRIALRKYTYVLDLELRYAEAAAQLGVLQELKAENAELKKQLESADVATMAAQKQLVQHRQFLPIISYAQPTIGGGSQHGVETGDLVFVSGVLVGRVEAVRATDASVKVLTERTVDDVLIGQTESAISGVVRGTGDALTLTQLPIEATLHPGERVMTTGQIGIRPGLYIGRVLTIQRAEGAPTQTAQIDQGVSFYRASTVEVGR